MYMQGFRGVGRFHGFRGLGDDTVPDTVSITPDIYTQSTADVSQLTNPTDVQSAILNYGTTAAPATAPVDTTSYTLTPTQAAIINAQPSASQNGVTADPTTQWATALQAVATAGLATYQQSQVLALQQQLVAAGKAPLTAAQIAALQPTLGVGISADTQNFLMYALIGGGILLLATSFMKHRKG